MSLSERAQKSLETDPAFLAIYKALANKYDPATNPDGVVIMGVAENSLMSAELASFFSSNFSITPYQLTYGDGYSGSNALRDALAEHLNETLHPIPELNVTPNHVVVSAGITSICDMLAWALTQPGEGILFGRPLYSGFIPDIMMRSEAVPVLVDLEEDGVDFFGLEAVERHEAAIKDAEAKGIKVRALILCNPHNPLGKCYPPESLKAYLSLCHRHNLHLISDEVYALSKYNTPHNTDAVPFTSILSMPETATLMDPNNVHVLYGMSKDFSSNGLRIGALITRHEDLKQSLIAVGRFPWASAASDVLWTKFFTDKKFKDEYIRKNSERLGESYMRLRKWLEVHDIPFIEGTSYGFFLWVDFRKLLHNKTIEEERWLTNIMLEEGVWIATGESFGSKVPGWFRVTFTLEKEHLDVGLERLGNAIKRAEKEGSERKGTRQPEPVAVAGEVGGSKLAN